MGERYMNHMLAMFNQMDKLWDARSWESPLSYCANNPIRYIDPDGRTIVIAGDEASTSKAVDQMQSRSKNLTFSRGDDGTISATGTAKTREEKYMMGIINDKKINVKINAQNHNKIDDNSVINGVGGAFMGNTVTTDENGKATHVEASQYVNVNSLAKSDKQIKSPGNFIWHEIAEGFEGGKISMKSGISATPARDLNNSIYNKAHYNAGAYFPGTINTTDLPSIVLPDPKNLWNGGTITIPRKKHELGR